MLPSNRIENSSILDKLLFTSVLFSDNYSPQSACWKTGLRVNLLRKNNTNQLDGIIIWRTGYWQYLYNGWLLIILTLVIWNIQNEECLFLQTLSLTSPENIFFNSKEEVFLKQKISLRLWNNKTNNLKTIFLYVYTRLTLLFFWYIL